MAVQPHGIPRFLPTLTEVVHVPGAEPMRELVAAPPQPDFDSASVPAASGESGPGTGAERMRQQVKALIETRLEQIVADALAMQIGDIAARLRDEMQPQLNALVDEAMTRLLDRSGPG